MKIVLLDEAQERFEAEDRWWREHRDGKELFVAEFEEALRQIASTLASDSVIAAREACHVYYFHDRERDLVEIHSLWGARRKRGPRL